MKKKLCLKKNVSIKYMKLIKDIYMAKYTDNFIQ